MSYNKNASSPSYDPEIYCIYNDPYMETLMNQLRNNALWHLKVLAKLTHTYNPKLT